MRTIIKITGFLLVFGSGLLMFGFYFGAMAKWLGFFGKVISLFIFPGAVFFPIIFWIVEGVFPVFYFIVWGIGIVGLVMLIFTKSID